MKVSFDHVDKRYGGPGGFVALKQLDLEVEDGEFLVLVGPSGCGKTTALRCLAGLEDITAGRIAIGERVVNDLAPKDRDIAMVFQSYALYPHMSVYENLAFSLRLRKAPRDEVDRRVREAAEILDLAHLLDRRPGQLSGGQRQRVALGRAIVREPAVFLMDEPLSNLDAKLRVATRAQIARLHRRLGTTIIYVTHDQVEAMTMGDRIAVMNLGVLQQVGTPADLYEHPRNRFVAGFIGSPSMNFLDSVVTVRGGSTAVRCADVTLGLSGRQAQVASSRGDGSAIVVGIRPEHLDVVPSGGAGGTGGAAPGLATIPASVDVVEFLGNENMIHATAADQDVVAVVSTGHRLQVGDRTTLGTPMDRIHLFDPDTGESLTAEGGGGGAQQPVAASPTSATPAE